MALPPSPGLPQLQALPSPEAGVGVGWGVRKRPESLGVPLCLFLRALECFQGEKLRKTLSLQERAACLDRKSLCTPCGQMPRLSGLQGGGVSAAGRLFDSHPCLPARRPPGRIELLCGAGIFSGRRQGKRGERKVRWENCVLGGPALSVPSFSFGLSSDPGSGSGGALPCQGPPCADPQLDAKIPARADESRWCG